MSDAKPSGTARLAVVDLARGLTILWVTAFHFYVDTRGVPGADATPAAARAALAKWDLVDAAGVAARSIVGLPGFRLDLLLFVTGLVLCLGRPVPVTTFLRRRAGTILPNYWLGSVAVTVLLIVMAAVRRVFTGTPFGMELRDGMFLGGVPYRFEWLDVLRSLSILGRLETPRTMQVAAPSMWYLVLIAQFYICFPLLRKLLQRWGPLRFLCLAVAVTLSSRGLVFARAPLGAFDGNSLLLYAFPCRLLSPCLGMVAAAVVGRLRLRMPLRTIAFLVPPVLVLGLTAAWLGLRSNVPGTALGLVGPTLPLLIALPGLWVVCISLTRLRSAERLFVWAGQRSLSLLVAQDFLRTIVGTLVALHVPLRPLTWWLLPSYMAASLLVTCAWHTFVDWCTDVLLPIEQQPTDLAVESLNRS